MSIVVASQQNTILMSASTDPIMSKDDTSKPGPSAALNGGFRPSHNPNGLSNPMVNVQPPRREDLQPSYAQTLAGESDTGAHGWYGSMSKLSPCIPYRHASIANMVARSQRTWFLHWNHGRLPLLYLLSQPIQASLARKCRSGHQVWQILSCSGPRSRQEQSSQRASHPS